MATSADILAAAQALEDARGPYNDALAAVSAADATVAAAVATEQAAFLGAIDTARANLGYADLQLAFSNAADVQQTAINALAAATAAYDQQ